MQGNNSDIFTKGFGITKEEMQIWLWSFEILRDLTEEMTWDLCLRGICFSVNGFGRWHSKKKRNVQRLRAWMFQKKEPSTVAVHRGMAMENAQSTPTTTHWRIVLLLLHTALKSCSLPPVECSTHPPQCSFSFNLLSCVNTASAFLLS